MSEFDPTPVAEEAPGLSRRHVLRMGAAGAIAAWTVPVIVTLQASPAGAASLPPASDTTAPLQPPGEPTTTPSTDQVSQVTVTVPENTTPTSGTPTSGTPTSDTPTSGTPTSGTPTTETPTTATGARGVVTTTPTSTPTTTPASTPRTDRVGGEAATAPPASPNNGGLAFTGAEIGGLVVLGTGAVALGTAAVWSARRRDEDDDPSATG